MGSFQWIIDDIYLEGILLLIVPFVATGGIIMIIKNVSDIYSEYPVPWIGKLIQRWLVNCSLPDTWQHSFPVRLTNIGQG